MPKNIERITAVSQGMQTKARSKNHEIIIDEPPVMGGQDTGPNPLGTLLSALAGCENVIANMVAKEMNFDLQGIEFDIRGEFDPAGLMGDPNVRPYFERVTIHAKVKTSEPEERIKELQEKTDLRCPVYTTLKAAGVEMVPNWVKA
ncbi:OsmC family protein [Thermoactinomyces sp. CICC 10522]|jgi:putative redox protein|uniref:OsmC family protein n=1 Tax=Thermoactinomyces sp. CICC 10522 TaxID=2767427 RepID=UPI0018DE998D|nr:OsmC family protein [Thermoactinomyces sp. CICC 10522]MBH8605740.1 OsmC family protein [Thermoactinomyces sp. CICC 10522]